MTTFTRANLAAGLRTFIKLPSMKARYDAAVQHYDQDIAKGVSEHKAIDNALKFAVYGGHGLKALSDPKTKLARARQAAGTTLSAQLSDAFHQRPQTRTTTTTKVVKTKSNTVSNKTMRWLFAGLMALIGLFFGLWFAFLAADWYTAKGYGDISSLAYWPILILTILFFGAIGYLLTATHQKQQQRGRSSTTTRTSTKTA